MIVEVRSYRIKPGRRAEFIQLFETRAIPALRSYGMTRAEMMMFV
jgi:heme-degrading monooxygenase HmoA